MSTLVSRLHRVALSAAFVSLMGTPVFVQRAASAPTPEQDAERLFSNLGFTHWGESLDRWQRGRQDDSFCKEFRGMTFKGYVVDEPAGPWAVWCKDDSERAAAEWVFYAVRPDAPIAARLEHGRWRLAASPQHLGEVREHLERRLDEQFGRKRLLRLWSSPIDGRREPGPDLVRGDFDGYSWYDTHRWDTADFEITLYRHVDSNQAPSERLELLVRTRTVMDAIALDRRISDRVSFANPLDVQFRDRVRRQFPYVGGLLDIRESRDMLRAQPDVRSAAHKVLSALEASTSTDRPFVMLVLDRLADLLWVTEEAPPHEVSDVGPALQGVLGLRTGNDGWWYPGRLRRQVWSAYPDTLWGDYAFLQLLMGGFGTNGIYDQSEPEAVLTRGEAFLQRHPSSPYRTFILFLMAQAAETRWSLSVARGYGYDCAGGEFSEVEEEESEADQQAWRREQELRWARAIQAYRTVVAATAPNELTHLVARQQLLRLQAGYDTGARYFFDCYL